jgi:hypothetical protein
MKPPSIGKGLILAFIFALAPARQSLGFDIGLMWVVLPLCAPAIGVAACVGACTGRIFPGMKKSIADLRCDAKKKSCCYLPCCCTTVDFIEHKDINGCDCQICCFAVAEGACYSGNIQYCDLGTGCFCLACFMGSNERACFCEPSVCWSGPMLACADDFCGVGCRCLGCGVYNGTDRAVVSCCRCQETLK